MHAEDVANHLQDLEYANGQRCEWASTLIEAGPVKAQLLLQVAEHRAAALQWSDAVVQLRGTPNAGDAAAMAHDALGPAFPLDAGHADDMLRSCIEDARLTLEAYRKAADDRDLPEWMTGLLRERVAAIDRQLQQLVGASLAASRWTPQRMHDDEDPDLSFMDDADPLELVVDHDGVAFAEPARDAKDASLRR